MDVNANIGAVPVTAFASTRSCDEIQRESEEDRRRRGRRVELVAVLAITLVAHTAAVALNTSVASAAIVDTKCVVCAGQPQQRQSTHLTKSEQRTQLIRSRAPSRPIWERSLLRISGLARP
jgi:hypothetical protein